MSNIVVKNLKNSTIDVSINSWGDGSSKFYPIEGHEKESWNRSDNRGFVMVITNGGESRKHGTYWYVKAGTEVNVSTLSRVTDEKGEPLCSLPNPFNNN